MTVKPDRGSHQDTSVCAAWGIQGAVSIVRDQDGDGVGENG
jgi:hypothetical protein